MGVDTSLDRPLQGVWGPLAPGSAQSVPHTGPRYPLIAQVTSMAGAKGLNTTPSMPGATKSALVW